MMLSGMIPSSISMAAPLAQSMLSKPKQSPEQDWMTAFNDHVSFKNNLVSSI